MVLIWHYGYSLYVTIILPVKHVHKSSQYIQQIHNVNNKNNTNNGWHTNNNNNYNDSIILKIFNLKMHNKDKYYLQSFTFCRLKKNNRMVESSHQLLDYIFFKICVNGKKISVSTPPPHALSNHAVNHKLAVH